MIKILKRRLNNLKFALTLQQNMAKLLDKYF